MTINSEQSFSRIGILIVTLVAAVIGAIYSVTMDRAIRQKKFEAEELARPARITVTKITTPQCSACFDMEKAMEALKQERVAIVQEYSVTADSEEGKKLILDHGIKKIPTYVVTGEIAKEKFGPFMEGHGENHGDAFIFTDVPPAYIDLTDGREYGSVDTVVITDPARCAGCMDPLVMIDRLKQGGGVAIRDEKVLRVGTREAQVLLTKYKIRKLPALIFSNDVAFYPIFKNTEIGTLEKDGSFVVRDVPMPYLDLVSGRMVRGDVTLIMLTDAACTDCYEVSNHKQILARFGVRVVSEKTIDVASNEGKNLLVRYGITKVPTILLSPEVRVYDQLKQIWKEVGKIAPNGWYIFNKFEQLGPVVYKDLAQNKIIRPTPGEQKNQE